MKKLLHSIFISCVLILFSMLVHADEADVLIESKGSQIFSNRIQDFVVSNGYVFCPQYNDSLHISEIKIYRINNSDSFEEIGVLRPDERQSPDTDYSLMVEDNTLYINENIWINDDYERKFYIYDVTNPEAPSLVKEMDYDNGYKQFSYFQSIGNTILISGDHQEEYGYFLYDVSGYQFQEQAWVVDLEFQGDIQKQGYKITAGSRILDSRDGTLQAVHFEKQGDTALANDDVIIDFSKSDQKIFIHSLDETLDAEHTQTLTEFAGVISNVFLKDRLLILLGDNPEPDKEVDYENGTQFLYFYDLRDLTNVKTVGVYELDQEYSMYSQAKMESNNLYLSLSKSGLFSSAQYIKAFQISHPAIDGSEEVGTVSITASSDSDTLNESVGEGSAEGSSGGCSLNSVSGGGYLLQKRAFMLLILGAFWSCVLFRAFLTKA